MKIPFGYLIVLDATTMSAYSGQPSTIIIQKQTNPDRAALNITPATPSTFS